MQIKRASGVLMHISSLWGNYSCGSFGKEALEFIDFLSDGGFSYWQVLPFCTPDEFHSPYKSLAAFGGNPYFIDLEKLASDGLLTRGELDGAKQKTPYSCEFDRLDAERMPLLRKAAERADRCLRAEVENFASENPYLDKACLFMAQREANGGKEWQEWTVKEPDGEELFFRRFLEYEFRTQWHEIRAYAHKKGIKLVGDIPIYVALDSADVWANRDQFLLDARDRPTAVAGVPPDYFSADGQLWGNPLYDWDKMKKDGYEWWRARLHLMYELFDGVRIDHFRGLESYWSIPAGETTAKNGKWVKGPGKDFIDAVKSITDPEKNFVIAEDLGEITPEVEELVNYSGFPGMRVLQFAFLGGDNPHLPHNYINGCVAYSGTHDNNTLLGYVWEQSDAERREMLDYIGYTDKNWDACYDTILRTMYRSSAGLVMFPIQDLLGYGSDTRLNVPGRTDGNWLYRITKEQLSGIDTSHFRRFSELYKRK